jgi:hypothetical protein
MIKACLPSRSPTTKSKWMAVGAATCNSFGLEFI